MEHVAEIVKIEERAKRLNLSPTAVYLRAGVKVNNFTRWKLAHNSPNLVIYRRSIEKVCNFLTTEEARLANLVTQSPITQGAPNV